MNMTMKQISIVASIPCYDINGNSIDCSHWGLTDLYPEPEKNLRYLLSTGEDFMTDWCSSKKEIMSARYCRIDGKVQVHVCQRMDDLWDQTDLIYDAADDLGIEGELTEDSIDTIRDAAFEIGIEDCCEESHVFDHEPTWEEIMDCVNHLADQTSNTLQDWYEALKEIVREFAETKEEED